MAYCTNPGFISGRGFVPCGQCPGCLINKRKEWADRITIESRYHSHNYFLSLTYAPEYLPQDLSVSRKAMNDWVKRLAYFAGYTPVHFGCGEYGDESCRPHYHCCVMADSDIFQAILKSWTFGRVDIEPLTPGRCKYTAGYVVKKMTSDEDPRLLGRAPEFWFGSRRPPIGYQFFIDLLERFATDSGFRDALLSYPYPPYSLRMGGHWIRVPRYIRDKLRPIFGAFNDEEQRLFQKEKKTRDSAILKAIAKGLPDLHLNWRVMKTYTIEERLRRAEIQLKSYKLKQRKIL